MTDVEVYQPAATHPAVFDIGTTVQVYGNLATQVANTDFVPRAFKGRPEAILACMLYGQEIGLGPMQSLKLIDSIQGTPTLKPEAMRALVRKAGHRVWTEENTDTAVTVCGWRREDPAEIVERVRWTFDDATRAKLTGKDSWKAYPRAMLLARATAELCRLHFADVIGGLSYIPDEVEDFTPPAAPPRAVAVVPAQPTTRRRPPTAVPDGMVPSVTAKNRLVDMFLNQGLSELGAKSAAAALWGDRGSEPIPAVELDEMIAEFDEPADVDPATGEIGGAA